MKTQTKSHMSTEDYNEAFGAVNVTTTPTEQDQQLIMIPVEEPKEQAKKEKDIFSDAVIEINDVPVTTSLKISEVFDKPHNDVMKRIRLAMESYNKIGQGNFSQSSKSSVMAPFIEGSYTNQQNKEQPMYYLTETGFSFVVMGFTGEKAAAWKWKYIAAFETMRKELEKRRQPKPMTHLEITLANAQALVDHEKRLSNVEQDILKLKNDVYNPFSTVRTHQIEQDTQIEHHDKRISELELTVNDKGPAEEVRVLIADAKDRCAWSYEDLYNEFYRVLRTQYGIDINRRLTNLKKRRQEQGWSISKVEKISKLDCITANPDIWNTIRVCIQRIRTA